MKRFRQYIVARSPEEAVDLRKALGAKALFIAGGTSVVPFAGRSVEVLIDVARLGLDGLRMTGGTLEIGATARMSSLLAPEVKASFPLLYEAARRCATPIIRNMATLGGSLATAFLPSDLAVALLAYGASADLLGDRERVVRLDDLLDGGWLGRHDLVRGLRLTRSENALGTGFQKFGRGGIDIALVNVASVIEFAGDGTVADLKICIGQTSSMPVLAKDASGLVRGRQLSRDAAESVSDSVAESMKPRSDFRASDHYRKHLVRVLVLRSIVEAAKTAGHEIES